MIIVRSTQLSSKCIRKIYSDIQNYFTVGLACVYRKFPLKLWCYLLFQAKIMLNRFRMA